MAWKKVVAHDSGKAEFRAVGDEVSGVFQGIREVFSASYGTLHFAELLDGSDSIINVKIGGALRDASKSFVIGKRYRFVYQGELENKKGSPTKLFDVYCEE